MIAKRLREGNDVAGIVHLVRYIINTQGKNHRVGEVFITNCISETPMIAVREMLARQLSNTRAESSKTYHLLVSFGFGEEPTEAALRKIEAELCDKLGFKEHQRVAAVHRDTDHTHMHVAINKIHPKKLTIHTPYRDFFVLGKACVELERKLGLGKDNHEPTGKTRGERQARDIEALTGNESLHTWIHREVFEKLKKADTWDALHAELARAGLTLSLRGAGVILTSNSGHRITGSNLHRSFSRLNLEKRLGEFQSRPAWCGNIRPEKECLRAPQAERGNPLREEYEKAREAGKEAKKNRIAAIAFEHTKKKEAILAENVADRAQAKNTVIGRFAKRRLYVAIRVKYRSQLDLLRAKTKRAKKAVYSEYPIQTWARWLQEQAKAGRPEALEALRRRAFSMARKNGAALRGEQAGKVELIPDQKIHSVTKRGTVIYDLGRDAVRDDGDSFRISAGASADTDVMALRLAQRRFGNVVFADGDRFFRERMIKAAVVGKVFITFGDPVMERRRNELLRLTHCERTKQEDAERQRPEHGHRSPPSGLITGLTAEEVRNILAGTPRKPALDNGRAASSRPERVYRPPTPGSSMGLSPEEIRSILGKTVRKPTLGDGHVTGGRPNSGHRSPTGGYPSGMSAGLTAESARNISANTARRPASGDGHAKVGRADDGSGHRSPSLGLTMEEMWNARPNSVRKSDSGGGHAGIGRADCDHRPPALESPKGLTSEEIQQIIANAVRKPAPGDGRAESGRPEHGHGRDEERTRGASPSR